MNLREIIVRLQGDVIKLQLRLEATPVSQHVSIARELNEAIGLAAIRIQQSGIIPPEEVSSKWPKS